MNPYNNFSFPLTRQNDYFNPITKKLPTINSTSLDLIDNFDRKLLKYIGMLHNNLKMPNINFDNVGTILEVLIKLKHSNARNYLECLLHPEKSKGCKIPSPIPVPSTSFQLHNTITLSTNKLGNLSILFNPYFLYNRKIIGNTIEVPFKNNQFNNEQLIQASGPPGGDGGDGGDAGDGHEEDEHDDENPVNVNFILDYCTSLFVNNDDSLDGSMPNDKWRPVNIGQDIPNVYNSYRLVSGCMQLRFIGQLQQASGTTGGAIIYDAKIPIGARLRREINENNNIPSTTFTYDFPEFIDREEEASEYINGIHKYGSNDLAQDSYYFQEVGALSGIREIYFPIDNSYEEYVQFSECSIDRTKFTTTNSELATRLSNISSHKGYNFLLYVAGGVKEANAYRVDIYLNFETLPNAQFLNYMPVTTNPSIIDEASKKSAIMEAHNHAIGSLEDYSKENNGIKAKKIMETLTGNLQNKVGKTIEQGLVDAVYESDGKLLPALKPAYALLASEEAAKMPTVGTSVNPNSNMVPTKKIMDVE